MLSGTPSAVIPVTSTIELHKTPSRACLPTRGPLRTVAPASPSVGAASLASTMIETSPDRDASESWLSYSES